jgi:glycosyltransferase involved in cell wall biosynthesis
MKSITHISVIIPVFNEEKLITGCLNALSKQTRQPDTIYIIDNNCTDASIKIARQYEHVVIIKEPQQGICISAKTGLDTASSESDILLRCDADSRPPRDWLEKVASAFDSDSEIIAVTGPGVPYGVPKFLQTLFSLVYMKPYFKLVGLALGNIPLFGSNFAIRAETWRAVSLKTHLAVYQDIHDDIDISYHIRDLGRTFYDASLQMPISARPFRSLPKMVLRYKAGFKSIFIHWPEQAPWKRR